MAADYKFYYDIGVEGIYSQAMGHGGGGGEFSLLRPYYATEFMQNHALDPDVVMYYFLQGYYEAAAPYIFRYAKMLQTRSIPANPNASLHEIPVKVLTDEYRGGQRGTL